MSIFQTIDDKRSSELNTRVDRLRQAATSLGFELPEQTEQELLFGSQKLKPMERFVRAQQVPVGRRAEVYMSRAQGTAPASAEMRADELVRFCGGWCR